MSIYDSSESEIGIREMVEVDKSRLEFIENEYLKLELLVDALTQLTAESHDEADTLVDQVYTIALEPSAMHTHLNLMAEALHKKWLSEADFPPVAAKICYRLSDIYADDVPFRAIIYRLVWNDFKDRLNVRKLSHVIFANCAYFSMEFFRLNYEDSESSIFRSLIDPLFCYLAELIEDGCQDVEISCFYATLVNNGMGHLFTRLNPMRMYEIMMAVRKRIVEYDCSAAGRCMLLEVLELSQHQWKQGDVPYKITRLYKQCREGGTKAKSKDVQNQPKKNETDKRHSSRVYFDSSSEELP